MLKEQNKSIELDELDVAIAVQSLKSTALRSRFMRTDCNFSDPEWTTDGQPISAHVAGLMEKFKTEVEGMQLRDYHGGIFQKYDASTLLTIARYRDVKPVIPTPRDLLHVYGPDKLKTKDWSKYFAYAWTDKGPHAIIYSDENEIIQQGKLACNSYSYSGQNSFALAGSGIFFRPKFGAAKISIRPYVQWQTYASFTGATGPNAQAIASLGIFVESWKPGDSQTLQELDHFIAVMSQNTQNYTVGNTAAGSATVSDGLAAEIITVPERKYAIYIYAFLETSADVSPVKNEHRFVTLEIDATIPFVVVEEKLL